MLSLMLGSLIRRHLSPRRHWIGTHGVLPQVAPHLQRGPIELFRSLLYMILNCQQQMAGGRACDFVCVCDGIHMSCAHIQKCAHM